MPTARYVPNGTSERMNKYTKEFCCICANLQNHIPDVFSHCKITLLMLEYICASMCRF